MEEEIEKPLDAAYGEMLYRQDRTYFETRALMTEHTPEREALDAAYEAFKLQMQSCTTVAELDALEAAGWLPE